MPNPNFPNNPGYNLYVGARYVPVFANPIEWNKSKTYEPLTVVTCQGNSFTSKTFVPANTEITNTTYWALTGNYNAQVEQYRQEVQRVVNDITELQTKTANMPFYYNVLDYGAVGDGITDDTTAFQNCFTAAASAKAGVFIPKGTYVVHDIQYSSDMHIIGYGATLHNTTVSSFTLCPVKNGVVGGYEQVKNVTIEGLSFTASVTCTGVASWHATNIRVVNCTFWNWLGWHCIEFNSTKNGFAYGNAILEYGGSETTEAIQIDGATNSTSVPGGTPYDGTACLCIDVHDNIFVNMTAVTPSSPTFAFGSHARDVRNTDIVFRNNTIRGFSYAVRLSQSAGYGIYDNYCDNMLSGFISYIAMPSSLSQCVIRGNHVYCASGSKFFNSEWPTDTHVIRDLRVENNDVVNVSIEFPPVEYQGNTFIGNFARACALTFADGIAGNTWVANNIVQSIGSGSGVGTLMNIVNDVLEKGTLWTD